MHARRVFLASSLTALCFLVLSVASWAQELPDAPHPSAMANAMQSAQAAMPPAAPQPLTLRERFRLQTKTTLAPLSFVLPAAEAGITMADPPDHYPREWADGGGAFGRNYGSEFGRHTTSGFTHFAVAAILREDVRYTPSGKRNYGARTAHALLYTIVDRSDSGRKAFAASNFVGAAAGGFVGMLWEPDGFDDVTHAYQRSAVELSSFASRNLISEFSPEIGKLLVKLHLGKAQGALVPQTPTTTPNPSQPDSTKP